MAQRDVIAREVGRSAMAASAAAALIMGLSATIGGAQAQAPAPAQKAPPAAKEQKAAPAPAAGTKAPAAKEAAANGEKQSAWVKICEKTPFAKKDKDGKETKEEKNVCITLHDRIDANTGMTLVSAAMRQIEGDDKTTFQIGVPLGMVIPAGVRAAILTKEQTDKLEKKEEVDPKSVKSVELKFAMCLPQGCNAEIDATPELIGEIKAASGILVRAIYLDGKQFAVPVPLQGFAEAFAGQPVDNAEYKKARGKLMAQIRQRQQEAYEKMKADQMKNLPPPPGGEAAPAAAPAPGAKPK